MKCQCCREEQGSWSWQPFGPNEEVQTAFTLLGSHYRGFPVIKVGEDCKLKIEQSHEVHFCYQGSVYRFFDGIVRKTMMKQQTTPKAPRYEVRYEDNGLFQLALQRVGGNIDLIDIDAYQQERETSTLPAAKSIRRALERRGHLVQGIYERVNIRQSEEQHSPEYQALHRGEVEWEWDEEQEVDE